LTLLLPLCRRAAATTCRRKVKHRITAPLRVFRLVVPPLALTLTTEGDVRSNVAVADRHTDIRASAIMTDANDYDDNDSNFDGEVKIAFVIARKETM